MQLDSQQGRFDLKNYIGSLKIIEMSQLRLLTTTRILDYLNQVMFIQRNRRFQAFQLYQNRSFKSKS